MAVATLKFAKFPEIDRELGSRATLKLAHNTVAYRAGDNEIGISYHGNEIARYNSAKRRIILSTAGWSSITTLGRLNQLATANRIGWVGLHDGDAILTAYANPFAPKITADRGSDFFNPNPEYTRQWEELTRSGAWYRLIPSIEFDMDRGLIFGGDHDHVNGLSTLDTAKTWEYISNNTAVELSDLSLSELRGWIKSHRKNIGYKSIKTVNVEEINDLLIKLGEL